MCQCELFERSFTALAHLEMQGKCPRAFHVTCARDNELVQHRVWEVQENEPQPLREGAPPDTQPEFVTKTFLKTSILCPTHNPVSVCLLSVCAQLTSYQEVKEAKKRQQADELKNKVMAFLRGQTVKIKSGSGSFEVIFLEAHENEKIASVRHQSG